MKKTFIILAEGFEEIEAFTVVDVLRRLNIICDICSVNNAEVSGSHGIKVAADNVFDKMDFDDYDVLILPGGMPGAKNLKSDQRVIKLINKFYKEHKLISAICAAPIVLQEAGIIKDRRVTSYPNFRDELKDSIYLEDVVVQDDNIITSRGPATALEFAFKIAENIQGYENVNITKNSMLVSLC